LYFFAFLVSEDPFRVADNGSIKRAIKRLFNSKRAWMHGKNLFRAISALIVIILPQTGVLFVKGQILAIEISSTEILVIVRHLT